MAEQKTPQFDKDYRNYDFEIIKEEWNEYELKDGTKAKAKLVLLKVFTRKATPKGQYEFTSAQLYTDTANPSRRREPNPMTQEQMAALQAGNLTGLVPIEVISNAERWNQYRLTRTDETIRIKLVLIDAYLIPDRYDELGEPVYYFSTGNIFAPILKGKPITP
jgi:hypothetical protein